MISTLKSTRVNFFSGDLPATNICLHAKFQVRWCYGFGSTALQQDYTYKKKMKNLKNCFSVFPA